MSVAAYHVASHVYDIEILTLNPIMVKVEGELQHHVVPVEHAYVHMLNHMSHVKATRVG